MSLRERLGTQALGSSAGKQRMFGRFGFVENPFPAAGQPTGHPHLETLADDKIVSAIEQFRRDRHRSQVVVIEGTQGVGKTNLLNYYQRELEDLYRDAKGFYIIRYYPDPEPSFDAIVRRVFQELGVPHLVKVAKSLHERGLDDPIYDDVRNHEVRIFLRKLSAAVGGDTLDEVAELGLQWLIGLRLLNRHRDSLGVNFRLDTVESKTQALRDFVVVSVELDLLKGIFLLLDELEKQDYSLSKTPVLRYLSAIRALIDALPTNLFLMLALTPDARLRYFEMLPAIASRLQNRVALQPMRKDKEAVALYRFYVKEARRRAAIDQDVSLGTAGAAEIIPIDEVRELFQKMAHAAERRAAEGVTHRDFLHALHERAEGVMRAE